MNPCHPRIICVKVWLKPVQNVVRYKILKSCQPSCNSLCYTLCTHDFTSSEFGAPASWISNCWVFCNILYEKLFTYQISIDWLSDWKVFYPVSAIFQPYNGKFQYNNHWYSIFNKWLILSTCILWLYFNSWRSMVLGKQIFIDLYT